MLVPVGRADKKGVVMVGNWNQDRYTQVDINDSTSGVVGEVDMAPATLADEAKADRAAGLPTYGTRGYADTEAFDRS